MHAQPGNFLALQKLPCVSLISLHVEFLLCTSVHRCVDAFPLYVQVSTLSGDLLVLAAGQARQMGRMFNVCPDALLDDGLLDFTLLLGSPKRQVRSGQLQAAYGKQVRYLAP
jgi:hypothetical protein